MKVLIRISIPVYYFYVKDISQKSVRNNTLYGNSLYVCLHLYVEVQLFKNIYTCG